MKKIDLKYDVYRWKWNNFPLLRKVDRMPIHLDIELTTRCGLKCPFCPRTQLKLGSKDMPMYVVKKIIDEFAQKGGYSIKFTYLGEPLMYKNLKMAIKYAKVKGIVDVMIATNGNILDNAKTLELIKSGLDFIIFSVDSCKPDIYRQIRKKGTLSKVMKGLAILKVQKQVFKTDKPRIQIQAIRMEENKEEIESGEYHKFFEPYVDSIRISTFIKYNYEGEIGEKPHFCCTSPFRRMTVRVDGKIAVCCGDRFESKIIGDINEQSLEDAWQGRKFRTIRKLMGEGKSHLIDCCEPCPARLLRGDFSE